MGVSSVGFEPRLREHIQSKCAATQDEGLRALNDIVSPILMNTLDPLREDGISVSTRQVDDGKVNKVFIDNIKRMTTEVESVRARGLLSSNRGNKRALSHTFVHLLSNRFMKIKFRNDTFVIETKLPEGWSVYQTKNPDGYMRTAYMDPNGGYQWDHPGFGTTTAQTPSVSGDMAYTSAIGAGANNVYSSNVYSSSGMYAIGDNLGGYSSCYNYNESANRVHPETGLENNFQQLQLQESNSLTSKAEMPKEFLTRDNRRNFTKLIVDKNTRLQFIERVNEQGRSFPNKDMSEIYLQVAKEFGLLSAS